MRCGGRELHWGNKHIKLIFVVFHLDASAQWRHLFKYNLKCYHRISCHCCARGDRVAQMRNPLAVEQYCTIN